MVNDGLNRYGYVRGNPTTHTDPTGHRIYCGDGDCGVRSPTPPAPPPTPTGCHRDGSCGCSTSNGGSCNGDNGNGGNGNGGNGSGSHGCGGNILCSPITTGNQVSQCDRICKARNDARSAANFWSVAAWALGALAALFSILSSATNVPVVIGIATALTEAVIDAGALVYLFNMQANDWTPAADWSWGNMEKFMIAIGVLTAVVAFAVFAIGMYVTTVEDEPIDWNPIGEAIDLAKRAAVLQASVLMGTFGGPAITLISYMFVFQETNDLDSGKH